MRYGVSSLIAAVIALGVLKCGTSVKALRKHQLVRSATGSPATGLYSRFKSDKNRLYSLVSCIGATSCDQRYELHDAFGLDSKQAAALSGPLKPRYDLWELETPKECRIIVDVDIPQMKGSVSGQINKNSVLKLCKISSAVVVHINPGDIRKTKKLLNLTPESKQLIESLGEILRSQTAVQIYVIIPNSEALGGTETQKALKAHLVELMGNPQKVEIRTTEELPNIYQEIKKLKQEVPASDIAKAIAAGDPNTEIANASLAYIREACFADHHHKVRSSLSDIYKGKLNPRIGSICQASILDSALAFYLRTFHLRDDDSVIKYLEQEFKRMALSTNDAYLRILVMAEAEAKSRLRQELATNPKQEPDELVNEIIADFEKDMEKVLSSPLKRCAPPEWLRSTIESMREQLREKLDAIVTVHMGLPKATVYKQQEKAVDKNHEKKKQRGVSMILSISAMLRERGYGNRQGYINYHYGPLVLTLGYANDRDVAETKPGTGIMVPAFRIQPQLHVNVSL